MNGAKRNKIYYILRTLRIKNQSGILDQAVQRLFISGCREKKQLKHKREAFDNSRKIWENLYH